jgi:hypothetical protein
MLYHTSMILLHRPPRGLFQDLKIASSDDVKICYESLEAITRLLASYSRNYQYRPLPITFVHMLASTASIILMKRYIESSSWDDPVISKPLDLVLEAIDGISQTWPCAKQVRGIIAAAMDTSSKETTLNASPESFDLNFMSGFSENGNADPGYMEDVDLEHLWPEDFFDEAT